MKNIIAKKKAQKERTLYQFPYQSLNTANLRHGISIYKNVIISWGYDYNPDATIFIDNLPVSIKQKLFIVQLGESILHPGWSVEVPQKYKTGMVVDINHRIWTIASSKAVKEIKCRIIISQ